MKKNNKGLMYVIFSFLITIIFPMNVCALNGSFDVNKSSVTLEVGGSTTFKVTANNATGKVTFSSNNTGICSIDKSSVWLDKDSTTVTIKAVSAGDCNITININGGSYDETPIVTTKKVNVKINTPKSSVNTLNDLKVDGVTVSGFSGSKISYTLKDNPGSSVSISATPTDSKSTVSGTGNKNLNYGKNTFNVVVTAENGSKKTYTIIINKPDPRSKNNYLKTLSVDNYDINFDKNTTSYTLKLEHNVEKININATVEDSKSKVTGIGEKSLNDYINEFKVVVTAENGSSRTYIVKAIRKDKDGNYGKLNTDNSVKSFAISNYDIKFDKNVKKYNLLVENIDELEFNIVPNDNTATVSIQGNEEFKDGLNKIIIQIVAENGDINEYLMNVYKISENNDESIQIDDNRIEEIEEKSQKNENSNYFWIIVSAVEFALLVLLVILYFIKIKKNK